MEPIPMEWVDKLFTCMELFYGERWTRYFDKLHKQDFYKTVWRNGLQGLNYDQIKNELKRCKRHAEDPSALPPTVMEFFRYAKGIGQPFINYHPKATHIANEQIAKYHISEMKKKLSWTR